MSVMLSALSGLKKKTKKKVKLVLKSLKHDANVVDLIPCLRLQC